jgi:hypothetical protein
MSVHSREFAANSPRDLVPGRELGPASLRFAESTEFLRNHPHASFATSAQKSLASR